MVKKSGCDKEIEERALLMDLFYASPDRPFDIVGQLQRDDELSDVPGFGVSGHEVFELAKYWARKDLDVRWDYFLTGCSGDIESALTELAARRLDRIVEVGGGKMVDRAVREVWDEWRLTHDSRLWRIFECGTQEERVAVMNDWWKAANRAMAGQVPGSASDDDEERATLGLDCDDRCVIETCDPNPTTRESDSDSARSGSRLKRRQTCELLAAYYSRGVLIGEKLIKDRGDHVSPETVKTVEYDRRRLASLATALGSERVGAIFEEIRQTFDVEAWITDAGLGKLKSKSKNDPVH